MKKLFCLLFGHNWLHYTQFLAEKYWGAVNFGVYPEKWCSSCGKTTKKKTIEIFDSNQL